MQTLVQNHVLIENPLVLVTPHSAFNSNEALMRILETTIKNVKGFVNCKIVNQVK